MSVSTLDDLLAMTEPVSPLDWARWDREVRGPLADYLQRVGCDWYGTVRGIELASRRFNVQPLREGGPPTFTIAHEHDRVSFPAGLDFVRIMVEHSSPGYDRQPVSELSVFSGETCLNRMFFHPNSRNEWAPVPGRFGDAPISLLLSGGPDVSIAVVFSDVVARGRLSAVGWVERVQIVSLITRWRYDHERAR